MKACLVLLAFPLACMIGITSGAQDKPAAKADGAPTEVLPDGARLRLGSNPMATRVAFAYAPVPPDYNLVMLADTPNRFRFFDLKDGKFTKNEGPAADTRNAVLVSDDGSRIVPTFFIATNVRGFAGGLVVLDTKTGNPIATCLKPFGMASQTTSAGPQISLAGNGKFLAMGGWIGDLRKDAKHEVIVWEVDKRDGDDRTAVVASVTTDVKWMVVPVLSRDGKLLATRAAPDYTTPKPGSPEHAARRVIQVWDVGTGKELFKARVGGSSPRFACVFSPDGSLLALSSSEASIDLWDVKEGKLKTTLKGGNGQGHRLAFSPDGKTLAAVATDGCIERWTLANGKLIDTTPGPTDLPRDAPAGVAFTRDGRTVAWGMSTATVVVWEAPSGKYLTPPTRHTGYVQGVAFSDDGKHIITSGTDNRLWKWDATTGKPVGPVVLKQGPAPVAARTIASISRNGKRAITSGQPAVVFDLTSGEELFQIPRGADNPPPFLSYAFLSADGSRAITVAVPADTKKTPKGPVTVWDVEKRKKVAEVEVSFNTLTTVSASLSPSGDRLVLAYHAISQLAGKRLVVVSGWDLKTGKKLSEVEDILADGTPSVTAISEATAVLTTTAGRVRSFDYEFGRGWEPVPLEGRLDASSLVLSPDRMLYAYGVPTKDPTMFGVNVHAWPSGKYLHTFTGHRGPISSLAFSPDGKTLASGSWDTTVLLWDLTKIAPK